MNRSLCSGKDADWETYEFQLRNYLVLLEEEFNNELDVVEEFFHHDKEIEYESEIMYRSLERFHRGRGVTDADATGIMRRSKTLFAILATQIPGAANAIIRQCPNRNGFEAFRRLLARFQPHTEGRSNGRFQSIVSWQFDNKKQEESFYSWEDQIHKWERESKEKLPETAKCGLLLSKLTGDLKRHMMLQQDREYPVMRQAVLNYFQE